MSKGEKLDEEARGAEPAYRERGKKRGSKSERSGASERMKDRERREGRGQRKPY